MTLADQATKFLAVKNLTPALAGSTSLTDQLARFYGDIEHPCRRFDARCPNVAFIDGFWSWRYVENPGAAWGLLARADESVRVPFFLAISIGAIIFIISFFRKLTDQQTPARRLAFAGIRRRDRKLHRSPPSRVRHRLHRLVRRLCPLAYLQRRGRRHQQRRRPPGPRVDPGRDQEPGGGESLFARGVIGLMHPVLFNVFGLFNVHTYGLMIALGFMIGMQLGTREARRVDLSEQGGFDQFILDLTFWILIVSMIGARLLFIIVEWEDDYSRDPFKLFKIWEGGLVFYGGFIAAVLFSIYYSIKHKRDFFLVSDTLIPSVALGHFFGRIGCFAAGCCWGKRRAPTSPSRCSSRRTA